MSIDESVFLISLFSILYYSPEFWGEIVEVLNLRGRVALFEFMGEMVQILKYAGRPKKHETWQISGGLSTEVLERIEQISDFKIF